MAYYNGKFSCRQKTSLILSVLILILGVLQLSLGILFSVKSRNRKCHKVKHMLISVYLISAGIFGIISYCPRKKRGGRFTERKIGASIGFTAVFISLCTLVTVSVVLDNTALLCISHQEAKSNDGHTRLYAILGLIEISAMYLGHVLTAVCISIAIPGLWTRKRKLSNECEKLLNCSEKQKSKQALHLPEAKVHIQEAPVTGERVTVVSLPESNGVVYAVPEQKYVVLRGGNTYMLPPGNTSLTPYFPTIRQTE